MGRNFLARPAPGVPPEHRVADQRFAATRPAAVVYVLPRLFVATTGTDADWVVKLIDVYPPERRTPVASNAMPPAGRDVASPTVRLAGYQQGVRGEPFRGKDRKGVEKPEPFAPGRVEAVNFTMPDITHPFRRGHRVRAQMQSSRFPPGDRIRRPL